jgi:drug/metabolite transporter (DMT)-like permease
MVLALTGIVLLFSDKNTGSSSSDLLGIGLGLTSALFYACIIILYRRLQNEFQLSLTTINTWRYCLSALFLLPFFPVMLSHSYTSDDFIALAFFGVLFAVIASGLHCIGMGLTKALHSSIIGKGEPVFAVLYAYLFLHETPAPPVIFGGCIVMAASLWLAVQKEPA